MKLGLISDIHGDIIHLKTALDLFKEKGVDRILCAGDVVFGLKQIERVIDLLSEYDVSYVRGNHDRWYLEGNVRDLQDDKTAKFLSKLPSTQRFMFDDLSVMLAHGAPWSDMQEVRFGNLPLLKSQFEQCCSDVQIVILGHTHKPTHILWNKMLIFNPGCVCKIYDHDNPTCAVLSLPDCQFEVLSLRDGKPLDVPLMIC